MDVQYLIDEKGRKMAVVVSLADWEALQEKIQHMAELSVEEAVEFDQADQAARDDPKKLVPIEHVMKGFGIDPEA